ncbi:MAG: alpha/beta hydrolase [Gammaproteobacteria bacterium]|nr:alpha/beta hydrolase [Gammaproteobacteria bacterium]MDH4254581.1 alpha/beta hydrolase [Gammaproteobacteria bacterium]MDH5310460.1 alpha/beta hydrolase [Gammaproteobacteria bacterium]
MYFELAGKRAFASTGGKPFDASKPTVMFIHGSALDHTFWGLHSRFFAFRQYSVLCPDLPGHTHSAGPCLDSIESMADWVADVVASLGVTRLSLVGHSQGCLVALELAGRQPEFLRSVSFIASGCETPVNQALLDAARDDPPSAVAMMIGWGFGPAGHFHQGRIPGASMLAGGRRTMDSNSAEALYADLRACNSYRNGRGAAASILVPAQVILGGKDRMTPRKAGLALAEALPGCVLHVVEESGHMVPIEAPDPCRALLSEFVFRHNPRD